MNFKRLGPGEVLSREMKEKLEKINETYKKTKNFSYYVESFEKLVGVGGEKALVTKASKTFLGGFIEGEGSMNVSLKKLGTAKYGVLVDPEFSITQHINGVENLILALKVFQTGRIRLKQNSNATLVYIIENRQSLTEKVIPFYEEYVRPYGCSFKKERKKYFMGILERLNEGKHKSASSLYHEILPLWDEMRMQKGQSNQTFADLYEAQTYVKNFIKGSSETRRHPE